MPDELNIALRPSLDAALARPAGPARWLAPPIMWRRGFRITLLLAVLWVLNVYDLYCTVAAHAIGNFGELNPIARALLHHPYLICSFKLTILVFSTSVLWLSRRLRVSEISCWGLTLVYAYLTGVWIQYFRYFAEI